MKITKVVEKANANQGIRRKQWSNIYIIPTNTFNCCELYVNERFRSSRWNPKKEDLIADDWEIVEEIHPSGRILPKTFDPAQLVH